MQKCTVHGARTQPVLFFLEYIFGKMVTKRWVKAAMLCTYVRASCTLPVLLYTHKQDTDTCHCHSDTHTHTYTHRPRPTHTYSIKIVMHTARIKWRLSELFVLFPFLLNGKMPKKNASELFWRSIFYWRVRAQTSERAFAWPYSVFYLCHMQRQNIIYKNVSNLFV